MKILFEKYYRYTFLILSILAFLSGTTRGTLTGLVSLFLFFTVKILVKKEK